MIPVPNLPEAEEEDWIQIPKYVVLVGGIIGVLVSSFAMLIVFLNLPLPIISIIVLLFWYLITACLHLDGLMDTFDGLACTEPERVLDAIRDSRVGAFGVVSGVFVILLKAVALYFLLLKNGFFYLMFIPMVSRLVLSYSVYYLKKNPSQGRSSTIITPGKETANKFGFSSIPLFLFLAFPVLFGYIGLIKLLFVLFVTFLLGLIWSEWVSKKINGHIGDTYGSVVEISEVCSLLLAISL